MANYDDIIELPRHVSKMHPQMPIRKRAAQFAPFAALAGYKEAIERVNWEHEAMYEPQYVEDAERWDV